MEEWVKGSKDGTVLLVVLQPGAKKNELVGFTGDPARLKIKIKAPPVEGKANKALIAFLSKTIGLRKNQIALRRGELSKHKDILVDIDSQDLIEIINKIVDNKAR